MSTITKNGIMKNNGIEKSKPKKVEHDYKYYNELERRFREEIMSSFVIHYNGYCNERGDVAPLNHRVSRKTLDRLSELTCTMKDMDDKKAVTVSMLYMNYNFKLNCFVASAEVVVTKFDRNGNLDTDGRRKYTRYIESYISEHKLNMYELIEDLADRMRELLEWGMEKSDVL